MFIVYMLDQTLFYGNSETIPKLSPKSDPFDIQLTENLQYFTAINEP